MALNAKAVDTTTTITTMKAIDLHVHILPRLDDGASSWEEALAMAHMANSAGTEALVATPHFLPGSWPDKNKVLDLAGELQEKLRAQNLPLRVYPGCEVYLEPEVVDKIHRLVPLGGAGPYLLVELPFSELPPYTEDILFRLKLKDIIPVLAHPERNRVLGEDLSLLAKWVRQGVLVQVNAGSLWGVFGRRVRSVAERIFRARMAHFLGSDGHSSQTRAPVLSEAGERIISIIGTDEGRRLCYQNAALLLAGQHIEVPEPEHPRQGRGIWAFWRFRR